jgi:hypothetical protein
MAVIMEGTRPLSGPALPNLINAVLMLKSKSKNHTGVDVDFDFNILTALKDRIGLAPSGAGCPPYYYLNLILNFTLFKRITTLWL